MNFDLAVFFAEYELLVSKVDSVFDRVVTNFPSEVKCAQGCSDCCHAVFDISLIEALYINNKFSQLSDMRRNEILIAADKIDRRAQVLKRNASRESGKIDSTQILDRISRERLRCPLLNADDTCALYEFRPITCRLYGIPLEIGGKSHSCGFSGFEPGKQYPAVKIERIQDTLVALSNKVLDSLHSSYHDFRLMHVPVSTALMTVYSEEYFGLHGKTLPVEDNAGESGRDYA